MRLRTQVAIFLFVMMCFSGCYHTMETQPNTKSESAAEPRSGAATESNTKTGPNARLTPPSFSLFESANMWQIFAGSQTLTASEVKGIPDQLSSLSSKGQDPETTTKVESISAGRILVTC